MLRLPTKSLRVHRATTQGGTETLLVVEDEASVLKLTARILRELGYHVLSAQTPTEALQTSKEYPADINLAVTDVVMPEMNGRELSDRLLQLRPRLKMLYVSGYTDEMLHDGKGLQEGRQLLAEALHPTGPGGGGKSGAGPGVATPTDSRGARRSAGPPTLLQTFLEGHRQPMATPPVSPVRMRTHSSRSKMKILPSPTLLV